MLPMLGTIIYINLFNSYNCIRCLHAHPVGKEVSAQRSVLLRAMQVGRSTAMSDWVFWPHVQGFLCYTICPHSHKSVPTWPSQREYLKFLS